MQISTLKRKLKTFTEKNWSERTLFFETYIRLGLARAAVLTLPFPRLSRRWGVPQFEEFRYPHTEREREFLYRLIWAIRTASKYTPWNSNCLAQAIAAKNALRKRGYTSTLYLGMTPPSVHEDGKVEAHAWLRSGDTWVCGVRGSRRFTVVATYADFKDNSSTQKTTFLDMGKTIAKLK